MSGQGKKGHARLEVILPEGLAGRLARVVHAVPWLQSGLDVRRQSISVPDLPAALEGFTVAQLSDLHVGVGAWTPTATADAAREIARANPDIVVNTGDFIQGKPPLDAVRGVAEALLHGQGKSPINVAILGNHDYFPGDDYAGELTSTLRDLGVRVLDNDLVSFERDGAAVTMAGLSIRGTGFDEAVARLSSSPAPRIALVHEPDVAERLPAGAADLVLAGHTHGGQIDLPLLRPLILRFFNGSRYFEGMYRVNDNPLYVNRGLGFTGVPFRFRAAPEITIFCLSR